MENSNTKLKSLLSIALFAAVLSGCQTPAPSGPPTVFNNKIKIAESIERLELYTRPTGLELSARDQVAVNQFLQSYARRGEGPIYVNVPSATAQGLGAQQAQAVIRQSLSQVGLPGSAVQTGQYQTAYGAPAPVVVSYRTLKSVIPDCSCLLYTSPSPRDS